MNPNTWKTHTTSNNKCKLLSIITSFFSSLNLLPIKFIFLPTCHLSINTWSLKLIKPIITSLRVTCTTTWKHFASSLWMNVADFIFWLLHILNLLTLIVLTPPHSSCTPFVDCAHLFVDCINSFVDCDNTSTDYANKSDDSTNIPNDWVNTSTNAMDTFNISSLDLCIPNPSLL